jgi:fructoselysine-6-P-deglycase FrlB-like protein
MSAVEDDIYSTPDVLRQTIQRVEARGSNLDTVLAGPLVLLGSGSSYCIGISAATLYEAERGTPAQALLASEYRPRAEWTHLAISRTGETTELVEAMRRARAAGARVGLIVGDAGSPAEELADSVLHLDFAPERGVIQTRFISAAVLALRMLIGPRTGTAGVESVPGEVERGLAELDTSALSGFRHVVFIGRGPQYGLALSAALTLAETALLPAAGHQTLDYRHGPIAVADEATLVWCFDPADDRDAASVIDDVRQTGATVVWPGGDALASLAQAQLLALQIAIAGGLDPDAPRNLTRAIVLPTGH